MSLQQQKEWANMAQFTVRVELHEGKYDDYQTLHAAMEQQGFSRLITSDGGVTYHLPWAEYQGTGDLASSRVRDIARAAADSTGRRNAILVTESKSRAWVGLAKA
jgi:hypothetical protein